MMKHLPTLYALVVAACGVAVFWVIRLPLPFLLGPMFACLAAALAGIPMKAIPHVANAMRAVLGLAVGCSITPELVGRVGAMATSVALVPVFVALIGLVGVPWFRRVCRFDPVTAYYAAMPGGLQDMIVFGREAGANVRALALVHVTRVLAIVAVMPPLMTLHFGIPLDRPVGAPAASIPLAELGMMLLAMAIGWGVAERVKLFGASILGPMIAAAAFSLGGLIENRPPAEAIEGAQFFIGLGVGIAYVGITMGELRRIVLASLGFCVLLAFLSLGFAELVHTIGVAPEVEALLAFAPGGQAEMAVLAIVAGVDLAYVVTHHLVRLIVVIVGAPVAARILRPRAQADL
jgi:membrane AbrB-like protein